MLYKKLFLLHFIYAFCYGKDYDDSSYWNNWSKNLNQNINQQVRSSLRGVDNLGPSINRQVQENLRGLDNLGSTINKEVQDNLRGLDNLGPSISQSVYEGLRPVREMQTRLRIKFGTDGTTIATFKDKQFIVRNGVMYECDGTISQTDGTCSGTLKKANFQNDRDFCYVNTNTIINNWYCLSNGNVNSGIINDRIYCKSSDGSPTLLIPLEKYKSLCGNVASSVTYKYFSNQPIGEHDSLVQCSGTRPYVCTMTDSLSVSSINVVGGNVGTSYVSVN